MFVVLEAGEGKKRQGMSVLIKASLGLFDTPWRLVVGSGGSISGEHTVDLVQVICIEALRPRGLPVILGLFTWPLWELVPLYMPSLPLPRGNS